VDLTYDALVLVSFGGPEGSADVLPFLENVLRGRDVPRERMLEVAEHYQQFGGVSPINSDNRTLISLLEQELADHGMVLPVYFGNRNWHPLLTDTVVQMKEDGVKRALAVVTSGFSSYSSCRQYLENIESARQAAGTGAPQVDKLRVFFNHPGFIESLAACTDRAIQQIESQRRSECRFVFTAHSIPLSMAEGCQYASQLGNAIELVADALGLEHCQLVYQSRSGPPQQAWLEPDISDAIRELAADGVTDIVVVPVGFISAHMEILFDLDREAKNTCEELGVTMVRADTVGHEPRFIQMLRELISERIEGATPTSVGLLSGAPHVCPADCCPGGVSRGRPA
jgi:ferrochelatase